MGIVIDLFNALADDNTSLFIKILDDASEEDLMKVKDKSVLKQLWKKVEMGPTHLKSKWKGPNKQVVNKIIDLTGKGWQKILPYGKTRKEKTNKNIRDLEDKIKEINILKDMIDRDEVEEIEIVELSNEDGNIEDIKRYYNNKRQEIEKEKEDFLDELKSKMTERNFDKVFKEMNEKKKSRKEVQKLMNKYKIPNEIERNILKKAGLPYLNLKLHGGKKTRKNRK
jgi:hypothetical protein